MESWTFRRYEPILGRPFSIEKLAADYPHNSPYSCGENRVIDANNGIHGMYGRLWDIIGK
ncbi:hypothetical protein [Croceimicrobium hydrocarbonivorans]|uniref:Uncharacterized protein n=1 Tax=Croceimicrobium hydrocarbonivorans TaxID=2761580 RepID=A0A7H0VIE8_9FLAO|nr:hypothetical protein [Croceimicrobium hydrocarbonivorans]QNR25496.1 hypothetical protein H4K34_06555 [Croceimicrobium hydrocarbonivorans]